MAYLENFTIELRNSRKFIKANKTKRLFNSSAKTSCYQKRIKGKYKTVLGQCPNRGGQSSSGAIIRTPYKTCTNIMRPLSHLNVDFEIISKVYAKKLKDVFPAITSSNQIAYVKDRSIYDI